MIENNFKNTADEVEYPAEFHFRVICDSTVDISANILSAAKAHKITAELKESNSSSSGKFRSYSISVVFDEREEMVTFDKTVKAIPGVRMLL